MLLVSHDPRTVRNSITAITTGMGPGIPRSYPLALNGLGAVRNATKNAVASMRYHGIQHAHAKSVGNQGAAAYHAGAHAKAKRAAMSGLGYLAAKETAAEKRAAALAAKQAELQATVQNAAPGSKAAVQAQRQLTTVNKQVVTADNAAVKAQAAAAAKATAEQNRITLEQGRKAQAAQQAATRKAAEANKKAATAAAHAATAQQHKATAAAHKAAAATAKTQRQDATAAKHEAAAAKHAAAADAHGKAAKANAKGAASDSATALLTQLKALVPTFNSKIAALKAKKSSKKLRGLMGLLGYNMGGLGEIALDQTSPTGYIDTITGAVVTSTGVPTGQPHPVGPSLRQKNHAYSGYGYNDFGTMIVNPASRQRRMRGLGDIVLDPTSSTGYRDTVSGAEAPPPGAPVSTGIDPTTGLPIDPSTSGSSCGSDPTVSITTELLSALTAGGATTAPKNCARNPNSAKCVAYNASQEQKAEMTMIIGLLQQLMAEFCNLSAGGIGGSGAAGCAQGYYQDPNSGQCIPIGAAGGASGQCQPGYYQDPSSSQCIPIGAASQGYPAIDPNTGLPIDPNTGMPIGGGGGGVPMGIDPSTGLPAGIDPSTGLPDGSSGGMPMPPGTLDTSGNPVDPNAVVDGSGLPIDPGIPGMPDPNYGPGGGGPIPFDPNLPPQYAGMPNPTDIFGDVAMLPPGSTDSGDGGDGSGGDYFIPNAVPIAMGPNGFMDFSADVQQLPDGATDQGQGDGTDILPISVDAYAGPQDITAPDYSMQAAAPVAPQLTQAQIAAQGTGAQSLDHPVAMARQALPPPSQIAMDQVPQTMTQNAPDEDSDMGPLQTQDENSIVAESFDQQDA